jgi:hypothetical protein
LRGTGPFLSRLTEQLWFFEFDASIKELFGSDTLLVQFAYGRVVSGRDGNGKSIHVGFHN